MVRALYAAAAGEAAPPCPVAVAAVGGYGREELAPHSDLDLWFIVADGADDPRLGRLAEEVLYPLWDLKLEVGHAVRAIDDAVALAKSDLTAATALLDLRHLAGDPALTRALAEQSHARLFARDPIGFAARLAEEKRSRHACGWAAAAASSWPCGRMTARRPAVR